MFNLERIWTTNVTVPASLTLYFFHNKYKNAMGSPIGGGVAQMVERSLSMREVPGSIPGASTVTFVDNL